MRLVVFFQAEDGIRGQPRSRGLVGASAGVLPRPGTPTSAAAAASRGLPDWKKFGNMLGVALGRDRRQ